MMSSPPAPKSESIAATWSEIDQVVDAIAQLAKSEESPSKFYAALLEHLIAALAAQGGAIWTQADSGPLHRECIIGPPHPWLADEGGDPPRHGDVIGLVLRSGQPRLIGPQRQASADDPIANPTSALLVLFPWCVDRNPAGLIELFQRADGSPQVQQGYIQFLEVIGELVAEFHRNCQLREFRQVARDWTGLGQFSKDVHGRLDVRGTAYTIANEGRRLLDCDRVSVLVRRGRAYRLAAVSGVEKPNRRAKLTRRLEKLCRATAWLGEPLYYPFTGDNQPPQIEHLLSEYLDESHSRSIALAPLAPKEAAATRPIGMLVAESYFGTFDSRKHALLS